MLCTAYGNTEKNKVTVGKNSYQICIVDRTAVITTDGSVRLFWCLFLCQVFFDLSGGNLRGARQIDYITVIFQKIKFSFPVIPHYKSIDMIFLNIRYLLLPVLFRDHKVYITDSFQKLLSFLI